jgi:hypothetical protein
MTRSHQGSRMVAGKPKISMTWPATFGSGPPTGMPPDTRRRRHRRATCPQIRVGGPVETSFDARQRPIRMPRKVVKGGSSPSQPPNWTANRIGQALRVAISATLTGPRGNPFCWRSWPWPCCEASRLPVARRRRWSADRLSGSGGRHATVYRSEGVKEFGSRNRPPGRNFWLTSPISPAPPTSPAAATREMAYK